MVLQEDFAVEQFMDKYETNIKYNIAETCCESISFNQLFDLINDKDSKSKLINQLFESKLTYGHIKGSPELKTTICQLYEDITIDDVIITNGAIGANFLTLYSIINKGDKVICIDPTYQQLPSCSKVFSEQDVIPWTLNYDSNYQPDLNELKQLILKNQPKLLILNNPNNPTGVVFNDSTMKEIVEICKQFGVWILCDEVYRPLYLLNDTPKSIINYNYENTISTSSTSKAFSLAGLRLGWIVTRNKSIMKNIVSKRDYNMISISIIDDLLATFALKNYKLILERNHKLCKQNLELIEEFVTKNHHLSFIKPLGGSVCFIKVENFNTLELCTTLAEQYSTLIVPGEVFNKPGFLRIGYGNNTQHIIEGLKQLGTFLDQNKEKF